MNVEALLKAVRQNSPSCDLNVIKKAYNFAEERHAGQKRESGEPYIEHPLQVARILAEHRLDTQTIAAGLLHDTLEDTSATMEEIKETFGNDIAVLIDGCTKIKKIQIKGWEERHVENLRKMIMASARDIRVIFIKLADKLHNMRTIKAFSGEKRKRTAQEVMDIYAPIAYKLGIASIKLELEELSFAEINPQAYSEISAKLKLTQQQREKYIAGVKAALEAVLQKGGIKPVEIYGRAKTCYSIFRKMQKKSCAFEEIYDLVALRVITKEVRECYEAIGIIHNVWKPVPARFKDFIALPKSNMYRSLHTTVIAKGQPIEIQVRTEEMDRIAEDGIAAHWQYKGVCGDNNFDAKLSWMKQVLEWQKDLKNSKDFMDAMHIDFFEDEIYAFTPKGDVICLPKGATVVDFAYGVHSSMGNHCTGGRVNGKFVPLRTVIENGDQVEVITLKARKPSRDWLKFVVTSKAKTRIKQAIREMENIPVKSFTVKGTGDKGFESWIISVENVRNPEIGLAKCCSPLPGEPIVGFATKTGKVSVHKANCFNIKKLESGTKIPVGVDWIDATDAVVEVKVYAFNRVGLFAEILNSLVAMQTQIKAANAKPISHQIVECSFSMDAKNLTHLNNIIHRIQKIRGVTKACIGGMVNKCARRKKR